VLPKPSKGDRPIQPSRARGPPLQGAAEALGAVHIALEHGAAAALTHDQECDDGNAQHRDEAGQDHQAHGPARDLAGDLGGKGVALVVLAKVPGHSQPAVVGLLRVGGALRVG